MSQQFVLPGNYKKWTIGLIAVGVLALLYGFIVYHPFAHAGHGKNVASTHFWAALLQNSVYFLLLVNTAMFFMCITTMAMGGWQIAFRRVMEAVSSAVPVMGILTLIILMAIVWGGRTDIYHWLDKSAMASDEVLNGKKGFLNPVFYSVFSIVVVFLWWILGKKMRSLSHETDKGPMDYETGKKWIWNNTVYASLFVIVFTLSVASTLTWLWLMSLDAHWYSTMYSWYTFASTFVAGISLFTIFVVWLKNRGQLEYVNEEHLHDLGKFMFAFSVFWAYLWYSQYMLIWYSNQPEETKYFVERFGTAETAGPYKAIFFLNIIINFIAPLLILMMKGSKRNWTLITFMAVLLIFGHWLDFYQMVMPGPLGAHGKMGLFDFGIACLFIGLIMWSVGRYITRYPLDTKYHPFMKESMIHHT